MIHVNCIGLGHWGPNLVRCMASSQRAKIGTVCDFGHGPLGAGAAEHFWIVRDKHRPCGHGN